MRLFFLLITALSLWAGYGYIIRNFPLPHPVFLWVTLVTLVQSVVLIILAYDDWYFRRGDH